MVSVYFHLQFFHTPQFFSASNGNVLRKSYSDTTVVPNSRKKEGEYQREGRIPGERGNIMGVSGGKRNSLGKGEHQGKTEPGILGRGKNT